MVKFFKNMTNFFQDMVDEPGLAFVVFISFLFIGLATAMILMKDRTPPHWVQACTHTHTETTLTYWGDPRMGFGGYVPTDVDVCDQHGRVCKWGRDWEGGKFCKETDRG